MKTFPLLLCLLFAVQAFSAASVGTTQVQAGAEPVQLGNSKLTVRAVPSEESESAAHDTLYSDVSNFEICGHCDTACSTAGNCQSYSIYDYYGQCLTVPTCGYEVTFVKPMSWDGQSLSLEVYPSAACGEYDS